MGWCIREKKGVSCSQFRGGLPPLIDNSNTTAPRPFGSLAEPPHAAHPPPTSFALQHNPPVQRVVQREISDRIAGNKPQQ